MPALCQVQAIEGWKLWVLPSKRELKFWAMCWKEEYVLSVIWEGFLRAVSCTVERGKRKKLEWPISPLRDLGAGAKDFSFKTASSFGAPGGSVG